MSKQKQMIRRQAQRIDILEAEAVVLRGALSAAGFKVKSYGDQLERVGGAHLIGQLAEAGVKYQVQTTRWQVALPDGVLEVESLPVAIQAIRDAASPHTHVPASPGGADNSSCVVDLSPEANHSSRDAAALLGDKE